MLKPAYLKPGDTIAFMCMAGRIAPEAILEAHDICHRWGLDVLIGKTIGAQDGVFGGTDAHRKNELIALLENPKVKAIVSARGGYGTTRYLDEIPNETFTKNPKWIIGFSDITAVLSHLHGLGIESIHGPMAKMFGDKKGQIATESLRKTLMGETISYKIKAKNELCPSIITATVVGGNLCMLAHNIGTKSQLDTSNSILFIEDIGEDLYKIDRYMVQLGRAGMLDSVKALLVGQFTKCGKGKNPFAENLEQIMLRHAAGRAFPVIMGWPTGHEADNRPLIIGREAILELTPPYATLTFKQ
jgi:muramoyltetrapeptide carboxypeptidase